jgi:hypothetical protein
MASPLPDKTMGSWKGDTIMAYINEDEDIAGRTAVVE